MVEIFQFLTKKEVAGPIIIIFIGYISFKILEFIISKISLKGSSDLERKRFNTIINLFQNICKYIISIVCILFILEIYGVDTTSIIAGLGIVGLVVGLSLQDTIKDFIAGISIIMDNYYIIGDIVEYNNFKGEIIFLGLRSTKIKKNSGEVLTFANRNISSVINYSQKSAKLWYEISTTQEFSIKEVEKVIKIIIPKIEKIEHVKTNSVEYVGVSDISNGAIKYALNIGCDKNTQSGVRMDINKLVKEEFDSKKITIK